MLPVKPCALRSGSCNWRSLSGLWLARSRAIAFTFGLPCSSWCRSPSSWTPGLSPSLSPRAALSAFQFLLLLLSALLRQLQAPLRGPLLVLEAALLDSYPGAPGTAVGGSPLAPAIPIRQHQRVQHFPEMSILTFYNCSTVRLSSEISFPFRRSSCYWVYYFFLSWFSSPVNSLILLSLWSAVLCRVATFPESLWSCCWAYINCVSCIWRRPSRFCTFIW